MEFRLHTGVGFCELEAATIRFPPVSLDYWPRCEEVKYGARRCNPKTSRKAPLQRRSRPASFHCRRDAGVGHRSAKLALHFKVRWRSFDFGRSQDSTLG